MISRTYQARDEIAAMCGEIRRQIDAGKRDVAGLGRLVDQVLATVPEKDDRAELGALLEWAKGIRYTRDPVGLDTIRAAGLSGKTPVTSTLLRGAGDCDDVSAVLGAACEYAGYPVRLVVTGPGGNWKHVYPEALSRRDGWIALDATEKGRGLGWSAPLPRGIYDEGRRMIVKDGLRGLGVYSTVPTSMIPPAEEDPARDLFPEEKAISTAGALALALGGLAVWWIMDRDRKRGRRRRRAG